MSLSPTHSAARSGGRRAYLKLAELAEQAREELTVALSAVSGHPVNLGPELSAASMYAWDLLSVRDVAREALRTLMTPRND